MSQLTNSYPVFEGNQVLTSSQLNQMVTYLDEQNRLTRVKLIGSGAVCGLELKLDTTTTPPLLNISKGLGVSSEGYLMSLGDCVINRYRPYQLPSSFPYPPFVNPDTKLQDVSLYELISIDTDIEDGTTANFLNEPSGFLDDKVVLLFMETVDSDLKSCLGRSCDDRGMNRTFTLRALLVNKTDLELKIIPRTCTPNGTLNAKYELPKFIIRNPRFEPNTVQSTNYNEFSKNYVNQILGNGFISDFSPSNNTLYQSLFNALRQTYTDFAGILAPVYNGNNPFAGLPNSTWTNFLNQQSSGPRYLGIQYFYDFIKELILAYNEFYDAAFGLMSECCPDMNCFPKHLLLGEVIGGSTCVPSKYRNYFTPSPAVVENTDALERLIMLHKRMVLMTQKFNLSIINNPSTTPVPPNTLGQALLITPSNEKRGPLGERAIPYYYRINEESSLGTLNENWSYRFIKECLSRHGLKPLAYGNQDVVQVRDQGPVVTPLFYDTDQYNFLRIEGAIRQDYIAVEQQLETFKTQFNLPFNFVTVRLSGQPFDDIKKRCNFDDIKTQYLMSRTKLKDLSCSLFDKIAVTSGEGVRLKPLPSFISAFLRQANSGEGVLGSVIQAQVGVQTIAANSVAAADSNIQPQERSALMMLNTEELAFAERAVGITQIPIYATRRTMSQAILYFQTNLLELARKLNMICNQFLPFDFNEFDYGYTGTTPNKQDGFIQTYLGAKQYAINCTVAINQIFDLVERSRKQSNSPSLYSNVVLYFTNSLESMNKLIADNEYKSLTNLYYLYQYRLQYLNINDPRLFSNFIKKHPGVSHQAGVPKGGTYVMVVNGNPVEVNAPSRDFAVGINRRLKQLNIELATLQFQTIKSFEEVQKLQLIQGEKIQLEKTQLELATGVPFSPFIPVLNTLNSNQVIADFTLPYLINCDCTCDEIPPPTTDSALNIPAISVPFVAQYSLGDFAYSNPIMKIDARQSKIVKKAEAEAAQVSDAKSRIMTIDVKDALQYDTERYSEQQIRLYIVNKNGVRQDYRNYQDVKAESGTSERQLPQQYVGQMNTFNHPNDPSNSVQYGTAGVILNNGVSTFLYYEPLTEFVGIDSFYYTFDIVDLVTGSVLQTGTRSVVTVAVLGAD